MAHPYDEFADIGFGQWAALGVKLGGRTVIDQALRDEIKFVRKDNEIVIIEKSKPTPPAQAAILPANDVVFELTLEPATQGKALVTAFGYDATNWQFRGQPMTEPLTRRFRLESVGDCTNLEDVRVKLAPFWTIPQGQWLQAFREAYPQNDGQGPIGVADPSWVSPGGGVCFPVLDRDGSGWDPRFGWAGSRRAARWRWLVACK